MQVCMVYCYEAGVFFGLKGVQVKQIHYKLRQQLDVYESIFCKIKKNMRIQSTNQQIQHTTDRLT